MVQHAHAKPGHAQVCGPAMPQARGAAPPPAAGTLVCRVRPGARKPRGQVPGAGADGLEKRRVAAGNGPHTDAAARATASRAQARAVDRAQGAARDQAGSSPQLWRAAAAKGAAIGRAAGARGDQAGMDTRPPAVCPIKSLPLLDSRKSPQPRPRAPNHPLGSGSAAAAMEDYGERAAAIYAYGRQLTVRTASQAADMASIAVERGVAWWRANRPETPVGWAVRSRARPSACRQRDGLQPCGSARPATGWPLTAQLARASSRATAHAGRAAVLAQPAPAAPRARR